MLAHMHQSNHQDRLHRWIYFVDDLQNDREKIIELQISFAIS